MSRQRHEPVNLPHTQEQSYDIAQNNPSLESAINGSHESLDSDNSPYVTKQDASTAAIEQHHTVPSTITSPRNGSDSWIARVLQRSPIPRLSSAILGEKRPDDEHESRPPRAWRATYLRFGPLSGIFCMLLASACLIASLGILAGSNGQLVEDWTAPPSTYLAIFTAIANLSLRYAAFHGVILAWWYRASNGSTLGQLHWDWNSGTTIRGVFTALLTEGHMSFLGLACLFSTVVVIDGPLLQRASTVRSIDAVYGEVPLAVSMAPELPTGITGGWYIEKGSPSSLSFNDTFITPTGRASNYVGVFDTPGLAPDMIREWYNDNPLQSLQGCPGVCKATIKAPAMIPTSCRTESMKWSFGPLSRAIVYGYDLAAPLNHVGLAISGDLVLTDRESINLITVYGQSKQIPGGSVEDGDCDGTIELKVCTLEAGIAEYDVTIRDGLTTLDAPGTPKPVALANNTAVNRTVCPHFCSSCYCSTLGGIVWEWGNRYQTTVATYTVNGTNPANAYELLIGGDLVGYEQYMKSGQDRCPIFYDPYPEVMKGLNKLMVYWGAFVANQSYSLGFDPGITTNTTVIGKLAGLHAIFHTDYTWFIAAAVVELICIALVAPTYWKYWTIGRPVSFSPLEIAKAFESRMLDECNSNSTGRDIARVAGKVQVRYGAIAADESAKSAKIAFSYPNEVESPKTGSRFDV